MSKKTKVVITFIISFVIAYFIVGYVRNTMFIVIDWIENVTIWDKLREYYIRTFYLNVIPALLIAIVPTCIAVFINKTRD